MKRANDHPIVIEDDDEEHTSTRNNAPKRPINRQHRPIATIPPLSITGAANTVYPFGLSTAASPLVSACAGGGGVNHSSSTLFQQTPRSSRGARMSITSKRRSATALRDVDRPPLNVIEINVDGTSESDHVEILDDAEVLNTSQQQSTSLTVSEYWDLTL